MNNEEMGQMKALYLGGTRPMPALFPALGTISVQAVSGTPILRIEEDTSHGSMLRSLVAANASAVFVPTKPNEPCMSDGAWLFGPDITHEKIKTARGGQTDPPSDPDAVFGIAYVPEHCQVSVNVQFGTTVSECEDQVASLQRACC